MFKDMILTIGKALSAQEGSEAVFIVPELEENDNQPPFYNFLMPN